ncbi:MAG: hypothetical protein H0V56_08710 [Chthoniobacterales bacterium]|nr:hypothetical protein [Chthoniobacterales bacterium]
MPDETPPQLSIRESRPTFTAWIGVVLLFCVFGLITLVVMAAMPRGDRYEQKRGEARAERLKTAREEADKSLHEYAWVDKEKGVARVPIQRAMELAIAELAQKQPAPAGAIAPGADQPGLQVTAPGVPAPAPAPGADPEATPKATAVTGPDSMHGAEPAAAAQPPGAPPGTQPGAAATPAASPGAPADQPPVPPAERGPTPTTEAAGSPLPVRGTSPPPEQVPSGEQPPKPEGTPQPQGTPRP